MPTIAAPFCSTRDNVLCCDIHSRARTKRLLQEAGAETVYGLDDILTAAGGRQRLQ